MCGGFWWGTGTKRVKSDEFGIKIKAITTWILNRMNGRS